MINLDYYASLDLYEWLFVIVIVFVSYLLGDISPAILIGKAHGIDIKKEGSGNAGTTNVLRVLGKKAAVATLLIDIGKGVLAVLLGRFIGGQDIAVLCGIAAFCGHIWPAFFHFKGGKGVATAFGILVAIHPLLGLSALAIVAIMVLITKRVSCGSITGAACAPFLAMVFTPGIVWGITIMALIVIIKHRSNIVRIIHGEEPKLSFKK